MLLATLVCSVPGADEAVTAIDPPPGLETLAASVARGPARERRWFAAVALEEMARVYATEAREAEVRPDMDAQAREALERWRTATFAYARQLQRIGHSIGDESAVDVFVEPFGEVRLRIDGRQTMLSEPRSGPRGAGALSERIAARYCRMARCPDAQAMPARVGETTAPPRAPAAGTWSFAARRGPVLQTSAGLHFQFPDQAQLQRRKRICLKLVEELEHLQATLRRQRDRGQLIEWSQLRLAPDPASGRQRVVLNHYGHWLHLDLPTLARAEALLAAVRPWLAARVEQRRVQMPPLEADRLLAGLNDD